MTEFITRNYGNKEFEVIIKTDSEEHYKETQDFARKLIDHAKPQTNADRIRAISAEELAVHLNIGWECSLCKEQIWINNKFSLGDCDMHCVGHCLEWLKKPAAQADNGP